MKIDRELAAQFLNELTVLTHKYGIRILNGDANELPLTLTNISDAGVYELSDSTSRHDLLCFEYYKALVYEQYARNELNNAKRHQEHAAAIRSTLKNLIEDD